MRQTKFSMKKIIRLILDEVIMSDRYMSDRQKYQFLQLPFQHWKYMVKLKIG